MSSRATKTRTTKTGVNDPCPCGQGKKFKKCCFLKPTNPLIRKDGLGLKDFDGHFWVEKDGQVIDPYFSEYDQVKRIHDCVGHSVYHPAPQSVQDEWIDALTSIFNKQFGSLVAFADFCEEVRFRPHYNSCDKNALLTLVKNGGKLVFGSLGWKKRDSEEIWWEYGGARWTNATDFLKKDQVSKEMLSEMGNVMNRVKKGELSIEEVIDATGCRFVSV